MRLRKVLGREAIETSPRGYLLRVHVDHLDTMRFEHLIGRARELLALAEPERAAYLLGEALSLWRGEPFTELAEWGPGRVELERLVELREDAEDLRTEALLRCGRHHEALAAAVRLVREAPFRERRWGLLALAQYQDGRQRDAMDTLHRARAVLVNELGLDPGPDLTSLERAILRQDPSLAVSTALPAPSPVCPYLGLVAYDIRDAGTYFGREAETAACLERLDSAGVLAIVGPSGCGKSSLARAGVAAALERDGRRVRVVVPGARPVDVLTAAPGGARSVLVVDQCEEALAPEVPEAERAAFFAALADFAASRTADSHPPRRPPRRHLDLPRLRAPRGVRALPAGTHAVRRPPARDRGPGGAGRGAPRAGPRRPPGPRGRASAGGPAPALARDASDVDPAGGKHPDRGRVPRDGGCEGGGVPVSREPLPGDDVTPAGHAARAHAAPRGFR